MRKLRVKALSYDHGWGRLHLLQERRWWGWKTIDREDVPRDVVISAGAFGDTGGWVSRFASTITSQRLTQQAGA